MAILQKPCLLGMIDMDIVSRKSQLTGAVRMPAIQGLGFPHACGDQPSLSDFSISRVSPALYAAGAAGALTETVVVSVELFFACACLRIWYQNEAP